VVHEPKPRERAPVRHSGQAYELRERDGGKRPKRCVGRDLGTHSHRDRAYTSSPGLHWKSPGNRAMPRAKVLAGIWARCMRCRGVYHDEPLILFGAHL
jgi:hypothetical protein